MKKCNEKIKCVDIKIDYNSLSINKSNDNKIAYDDDNINIINNILCGDPERNFLLNVNDQVIDEVYIDSSIGNININYLKAYKVIINSTYGKVNIKGSDVKIDKLIINSDNGDVNIKDINCKDVSIKTIIGDVFINSNSIDDINVISQTGDLYINSSAKVNYKTMIGNYKNSKGICLDY